jgi:hypothetical protein
VPYQITPIVHFGDFSPRVFGEWFAGLPGVATQSRTRYRGDLTGDLSLPSEYPFPLNWRVGPALQFALSEQLTDPYIHSTYIHLHSWIPSQPSIAGVPSRTVICEKRPGFI